MLSADKTKSVNDLAAFAFGQDVLLSWKLDGLTLVLRYQDGIFMQAVTRGRDGIVGEGVVSWKNFERINRQLEVPYSHPRGFSAGSVRKMIRKVPKSGCWNL